MNDASRAASALLDRFFQGYFRQRPVNATFVGVHDHDGDWPDCSEAGLGDLLAEAESLIPALDDARALLAKDSAAVGDSGWETRLDLELAAGHLRTQRWELGSRHVQWGNPSWYTGEAAFGILGLFLTDFAPLETRVTSAVARLEGLPDFLEQGRVALRAGVDGAAGGTAGPVPAPWIDRALRECRGLSVLLGEGLERLGAEWKEAGVSDGARAGVERSRKTAQAAAADFAAFLRQDLPGSPDRPVACGADAFAMYLRYGHCVDDEASDVLAYAQAELERAQAELDGTDADADRAAVEALHPGADEYLDRFERLRVEVQATVESHDLLTWPDVPIRFVPRPSWTRKAAEDLYFLYYRSPAAYERPPVHDYLVAPLSGGSAGEEDVLRAHNEAVIKLNHVIHHGSVGHHVQNWHAFRARSRVGRIAAVDCASRIAMFSGGTMAEGWACYATDLMREVGFLTPLEERLELRSRVRMCARAIVDVELHHGTLTLDEAAAYYTRVAGMAAGAARAEAVKNSMFPGAAVMYMLGRDRIHRLRAEMSEILGSAFDLRTFHDRFLSYGSVPVTRVAAHMTRRARRSLQPARPHVG